MSRFKVGDRVRVVGLKNYRSLNGAVAVVVAVDPTHCTVTGRLWLKGREPFYEIDIRDSEQDGNCGLSEHNLRPYYDGNDKVSWSECAWKPNRVAA